jgi:glycosyltransferase involved in cell wall biosynthesis
MRTTTMVPGVPELRVWIVNHYAAPPSVGDGTRHYDLSRVLVARGHEVVIFASSFAHHSREEVRLRGRRLSGREVVGGVTFRWIRTIPYRQNGIARIANTMSFAALVPVVQLLHRRPDVVIGSTVHPFAALSALLVARLRGARFIFEIRDLWPETLFDIGAIRRGSLQARILARIEALLCRHADHVICLMPGAIEYLTRLTSPGTPVTNLPNGVDLGAPEGPIPPQAVEAILNARRRGSFVAAWVGSLSPVNGLDTIVEAAALLDRTNPGLVHILFVGDGPQRGQLMAMVQERDLKNVTFVGSIPKSSVRPFLRRVDAGLVHALPLPVLRFGISLNKIFDYFAAERPVVFACVAFNDPVADAGSGISVDPLDAQAFADAIVHLAELSPEDRAVMGRRALDYVRERHDTERLGIELASIIEGLGARRAR